MLVNRLIQILSKTRTQNVFLLAFSVFGDFWADDQTKICPWAKKRKLFPLHRRPFDGGYVIGREMFSL